MKKEKVLFLVFLIILVCLFALCGYSLIKCFVYNSFDADGDPNILDIAYLFLHLIMIAIVFYLAFRAYKIKSSILYLFYSTLDDNKKIKGYTTVSLVLSVVLYAIGIYSTLHIFGLPCPPLNYLSATFSYDFMNAGYFFGTVALVFFIYPFIMEKKTSAE